MKKIIILLSIIMVVLATGSRNVYAGKENFSLYEENEPATAVSLYEEAADNSELRAAGDRPGNGDGIGQEGTPLGDGVWIIFFNCILFALVKAKSRSRRHQ